MASKYPPFKEAEAARPEFDTSASYTLTKTVDPDFKAGQGLNSHPAASAAASDSASYHVIELGKTEISPAMIYKLLISGIAPRPVALVTTLNEDGSPNLAPISWYQMVSHNPATVMISFGGSEDRRKDSELNIGRLGEFSISASCEPMAEALNFASIDSPHGVSEFALTGLTPVKSKTIQTPRIKESPFSMECTVLEEKKLYDANGKHTTTLVLGNIKAIHIRKDTINPQTGAIDAQKTLPITRIGGLQYARTTVGYELERPKWDVVKDTPEVKQALERGVKPVFENTDPILEKYP
ncbi:uncharacterized protein PFL1_03650 [Pseudozyma flocculosa PF-1]|uniref:Related to conserved protein/domain typically associated with flavoprotein oxygenases, DIM6/NTAB family n=2 Tax=Pseudozyma flocculosa TaxID=84751 RepID=A0A5C3F7T7_9BASI|nr:uncharacterized protein PFL1_03650 [Pseudozyma flocculosa PF-1]EPQ28847.1 hypothetical protein PFL1_03650 [Pseudozyma flocculosa PF-1]SPO39361.1 related to conserved protein/domain typically associated with flavoprotein oxygenases, DIM6/NTAB family [Pseudozyma flocculosa]